MAKELLQTFSHPMSQSVNYSSVVFLLCLVVYIYIYKEANVRGDDYTFIKHSIKLALGATVTQHDHRFDERVDEHSSVMR